MCKAQLIGAGLSRRLRYRGFAAFICLLLTATLAAAQGNPTGTISGRVMQQDDAVMPGVTVTVTHLDTNTARVVQTNDAGVYRAPLLPLGTFSVAFNL